MSAAISVENLGKRYMIGAQSHASGTAMEAVADAAAAPFRRIRRVLRGETFSAAETTAELWALRDLSLEVEPGEVLGVVGSNGAGKSTLLKVLARITEPTTGRVRLRGRIGALLEVGTGFHPELTGRENTYLNGAILGMRKGEIAKNFDAIVAFAGVERHIDTPVKFYSSGMYVRLAFAVAAHLNPEILVVDEVLAVGDLEFRRKCLGKMEDVAKSGRTVLFVSHNLSAVTALCTRAILLESGRITADEAPHRVIERYANAARPTSSESLEERTDRGGRGPLRFTAAEFLNEWGQPTPVACSGGPLSIRVSYKAEENAPLGRVDVDITFCGQSGQLLLLCKASLVNGGFETLPAGRGQLTCTIPKLPLSAGEYSIKLWAGCGSAHSDRLEKAASLVVEPGDYYGTGFLPTDSHKGVVLVDHRWTVGERKTASTLV